LAAVVQAVRTWVAVVGVVEWLNSILFLLLMMNLQLRLEMGEQVLQIDLLREISEETHRYLETQFLLLQEAVPEERRIRVQQIHMSPKVTAVLAVEDLDHLMAQALARRQVKAKLRI
jgi:hypothetical protein